MPPLFHPAIRSFLGYGEIVPGVPVSQCVSTVSVVCSTPAATAAAENSAPATLAASRILRSSGLTRASCCSINWRRFSGTLMLSSASVLCISQLPIASGDHLARHQLIGHVDHEQRIAIRALVNDWASLWRDAENRPSPRTLVLAYRARVRERA